MHTYSTLSFKPVLAGEALVRGQQLPPIKDRRLRSTENPQLPPIESLWFFNSVSTDDPLVRCQSPPSTVKPTVQMCASTAHQRLEMLERHLDPLEKARISRSGRITKLQDKCALDDVTARKTMKERESRAALHELFVQIQNLLPEDVKREMKPLTKNNGKDGLEFKKTDILNNVIHEFHHKERQLRHQQRLLARFAEMVRFDRFDRFDVLDQVGYECRSPGDPLASCFLEEQLQTPESTPSP